MKKFFLVLVAFAMVVGFTACTQQDGDEPVATTEVPVESATSTEVEPETAIENPVIRLSTTTSVNDSGLLPYLQPYFESDTGYTLEITSAGTGAAIEKARNGDADCLLVHSKASEEEYCNEGYGEVRVPFIYNYFVIVGPAEDPAGVKDSATAGEAFQAIADAGATFITRGDASGTNKAELKIWDGIGYNPDGQEWYVNIGEGMGRALTVADEMQAYTLSDKATYLAHEDSLSILMEESDEMMNTYSMIAVTPDRWSDTNYAGALAFIDWMTSEKALDLIAQYGTAEYGEPLFFVLQ
ncbi:MAG TPA: tungsten ABC transporter substrate-binding protein [Anaerolineaceae bacterium]|nr:tungsten ABC transporter substrate-binding protein [Anaerolineaceae bacterium]